MEGFTKMLSLVGKVSRDRKDWVYGLSLNVSLWNGRLFKSSSHHSATPELPYQSVKTLAKSKCLTSWTVLQHLTLFTLLSTRCFLLSVSVVSHLCVDSQIWMPSPSHSLGSGCTRSPVYPGSVWVSLRPSDSLRLKPADRLIAPCHHLVLRSAVYPVAQGRVTVKQHFFLPLSSHPQCLLKVNTSRLPLSSPGLHIHHPDSHLLCLSSSPSCQWSMLQKMIFLKCRTDRAFPYPTGRSGWFLLQWFRVFNISRVFIGNWPFSAAQALSFVTCCFLPLGLHTPSSARTCTQNASLALPPGAPPSGSPPAPHNAAPVSSCCSVRPQVSPHRHSRSL